MCPKVVPDAAERTQLSQELEMYKRATGLLGFDIAINDRTNLIPVKFHLVSTFKFKISFFTFNSLSNSLF